MKKIITLFLFCAIVISTSAQNLTLSELQNLCKLSNWENGANTLTRKGWEYHDSKRGDTYEYSTISYAHSKDEWNGKYASAWFQFYTYNNRVERIAYQPTDNAFKAIKASLASNGYKQIDNQIYNNFISTTYNSPSFTLVIETTTQERMYGNGTIVSYNIYLTRKGGIYDDDNGEKVIYYYGTSTVKERYTLKNGKRNGKAYAYSENGKLQGEFTYSNGALTGAFTVYHDNGNPSVSGTLINGEKNGLCTEYDYYGNKKSEQYYKNGKYEGKVTIFNSNGQIDEIGNFTNGEKNGLFVEYIYDNNGEISIQITGKYFNDNKDGLWETKILMDGEWKTILYSNYSNGKLHGASKEWTPDSDTIVICNYNYGILDGKYQVKGGFLGMRNIFNDNTLVTITDGYYTNGKKSGYWTYKNALMQPVAEGKYVDDEKEGIWKYYYINSHLDCIANYHWGKLHGKYIKYKKQIALNSFNGSNEIIKDSIDYICNYSFDELNGHFERHDNNGNIISEGDFYNNMRNGRWTETDIKNDAKCYLNYVNGKLDGLCEIFSYSSGTKMYTNNYKNNKLEGRQIWWDYDGKLFMESDCKNGYVQRETVYNNGLKYYEINITKKSSYSFSINVTIYYTEKDNPDISRSIKGFYVNEHPDSVLTRPFCNLMNQETKKQAQGKIIQYDRQNREVVNGEYSNDKETGNWTYTYYDQNLYYIQFKDDNSTPMLFYTIDDTPYSGKFTREENKSGTNCIAVYKIKKSLIEDVTYQNPQNGKTIVKKKYKDGLPL